MNINLWFARDNHGEIITILNSNNANTYTCPICNSEVIPKALESKKVTPHFAHIDRSKCTGESFIHFWMKHGFIERGDTFTIISDESHIFTCKDFKTEVTFNLKSGVYRPDIVIETECGNEIVFEMAHKNKKKVQDYIDRWIELDKIVVEVDTPILTGQNEIKEFKALYYNGKCFNFNKRDGGYYKTIGKLKEKMKRSNSYDIELAKKLDWFWQELFIYTKEDKRNSCYFFELLEYVIMNSSSCYEIKEMIKKHKFEYIYKDYCEYKNEQMKDHFNKLKNKYQDYEIKVRVADIGFYNELKFYYSIKYIESNGHDGLYASSWNAVNELYLEQKIDDDYCKLESKRLENWLKDKFTVYIKDRLTENANLINIQFIKKYNLSNGYKVLFDTIFVKDDFIELLFDVHYNSNTITRLRFSINNDNLNFDFMIKQLFKEIDERFKEHVSLLRNMENIFGIIYKYIKIKHNNSEFYLSQSYNEFNRISMTIKEYKPSHGWKDIFEYEIINGKIIGYNKIEIMTFDSMKSNFAYFIENKVRHCKCRNCNQNLNLIQSEIKFFLDRGLELPKRCKLCRQKRKQLK